MPISFIPYTAVYGPLSLPGATCALWLDGADPLGNNSVPANGATVSTWVDKSRNGRNATGGVSPTYNTSQKAIVFNGSSWLTTSYSSVPTNETIFIVYQTTSSAVGANCFMIGPSDFLLGGRLILTVNENDGFGLSFKIGSYGLANGSRLTMAQNQMYIGTTTVASTTSYVYLNGTQGPSSTLTYSGTGTTQIGTAASGSAIYIGYIYEIVIYNTNLTTPQQQSIEGYLAQKWGLTSQLPPGHQGLKQTLYNGKVYQPQISLKPAPYANYYPLSLAGCALWLDAADPAGTGIIPANGSTVSTWADKSGNGYNGTSGAGPIYTTDAQGRKCMSFTGTQFLESVVTVSKQNHSLIAVHAPTYTNGFNNSGSTLGGNSSLFRFQIPANAGGYIVFPFWYNAPLGYVSNYGTTNGALPDNSVAGAASIINANIGPQTQYSYKNGIQQGTESASLVTGTTPPLTIGRYTPGLSEYYQGYVYEMIIYNTALTTTQRQNIEGYLAWKWGLQGSLINHPYSSAPPLQYTRGAILPPPTLNAFGRVAYASMTPYYNVTPQTWLSVWQPYLQELVAANSGATASLSSTGASVTSTNTGAAIIAPNGNIYYSVVGSSISYYNPTTNAVNSIALGQAIDSPSAVLGADGNMYMYPTNANTGQNIIKITTSNNTASTISAGTNGWWGMILAPNGNIYGIPARTMTNVLVLNTTTGTRTTITGTTNGYWGGVLAPNGKIYCIPGPSVAIIDPVAGTITPNAVSGSGQANGYFGGVLGWDGNIYCIPSGTTVGVINPNTNTFTTFASNSVFYSGGCLGPDGKIYCIPRSGGAIGVINIATQSFSASSLSLPTGATYNGATLAPSGIIYVSPYTSGSLIYKITFSGLSLSPYLNLCLTPYINKF